MAEESISYVRMYLNGAGKPAFAAVAVAKDSPESSCGPVEDETIPFGLYPIESDEEREKYEKMFKIDPVCPNANLYEARFGSNEPPGFLEKAVDNIVSGLIEGIGHIFNMKGVFI